MTKKPLLISTSLLSLCAVPAFADLSAQDVWDNFVAYSNLSGQELSAQSLDTSGNTLTAKSVSSTMQQAEGDFTITYGDVVFTELGDGTVSVQVPETYALQLEFDVETGESMNVDINLENSGFDMVASGDPSDISYRYALDELRFTVETIEFEGDVAPVDASGVLSALSGNVRMTDGEPATVVSDFASDSFTMTLSVEEESQGSADINIALNGFQGSSDGSLMPFNPMSSLGDMIASGMRSQASFTYDSASIDVDSNIEGDPFAMNMTTGSGGADIAIDENGLFYVDNASDIALSISSAQIPLPDVSMALASAGSRLTLPIGVSEEAKEFGLALGLNGLTISDSIWSIFDPAEQLPRDPAILEIDLSGVGKWFIDITDPELDESDFMGMPGEVDSLTLNKLLLTLAGAELTGSGDFTIDNSSMPPVPAGEIDLSLIGGNTLLDTLVSMGLVPEDQAMGARMMLGVFATPGDGEDSLVSKIEFTPEGGIIANGQRLR